MAIIDQLNTKKLYDGKVSGAGSASLATVSAVEKVDGAKQLHKVTLTLADVPVPIVSSGDANGVGGVNLYTLPEGIVKVLQGVGHLSLSIDAAEQANFTDATPEGDIGVGTVSIANEDAFGTDATDDDILTGTGFVCSSYADSDIDLPFDAEAVLDGTEAAKSLYLNVLVDNADLDNAAETEVLISGEITLIYQNLGDV